MFVCLFACVIADSEYTDNSKLILVSFSLEKTVFGICGTCSLLNHSALIPLVKLTLKQLQNVWRFQNRLMIPNYCRLTAIPECLGIFWWEMFFRNSISITLIWCINHIVLLDTFFPFSSDVFINQLDFFLFQNLNRPSWCYWVAFIWFPDF